MRFIFHFSIYFYSNDINPGDKFCVIPVKNEDTSENRNDIIGNKRMHCRKKHDINVTGY